MEDQKCEYAVEVTNGKVKARRREVRFRPNAAGQGESRASLGRALVYENRLIVPVGAERECCRRRRSRSNAGWPRANPG